MGVDFVYMGMCFIVMQEVYVIDDYKYVILNVKLLDIIYMNFFMGVYGNYICESIEKVGFDLDVLLEFDKIKMNFGSDKMKVWKDIWGVGQGVGLMDDLLSVGVFVEWFKCEYDDVKVWFGILC